MADDAIANSPLALQPEALQRFLVLYGLLWSHGEVDHTAKEVARLRNARVTDCGYGRNIRVAVARQEGLDEAQVELIADGFEASALDARAKAVIRYTDVFLRGGHGLDDGLRAEMLERFTPAQVVELTAGIALFMGFSKIAVSLGTAPDDMPTMVVPTPELP